MRFIEKVIFLYPLYSSGAHCIHWTDHKGHGLNLGTLS